MQKFFTILAVTGLAISLAACSGFKPVEQDKAPGEAGAEEKGEARYGAEAGGPLDIKQLDDPNSPLAVRVIYFDLDSSQVNEEGREVVSIHARLLSANPDVKVVLEGHTDERGTREYNLALGERRARAVQQLMLLQGVAPDQIQVISFGEERPVALDHDEAAWKLNRRVEILYSGI
ncbi:MAG TPA: peptidoglycan-associated lipoprotein Pal [Chromatiales bacterium]|nr:peptidoglycan-associated lipoprotein Pal [Chromatiales bacterium]